MQFLYSVPDAFKSVTIALVQMKDVRQLLELTLRWERTGNGNPQVTQKHLPKSCLWRRTGWVFIKSQLELEFGKWLSQAVRT